MKLKIREARKACGMTQLELANLLGVKDVTLSGYELGQHDPKSDTLVKIAKICGVTVDYLLGREETESTISEEALAFARAYDQLSEYSKAIIATVLEQDKRQRGARRMPVLTAAHDSDIYARYLSKREAEEVERDSDLITHRY